MKKLLTAMLILALLCGGALAQGLGAKLQVVNCDSWVSLRKEPDKASDRLKKVPLSAFVALLDEDCGDFAKVVYDGKSGYVLKEYLALADDYSGNELSLGREQRYNLNLFLSNFSEQYFAAAVGSYDEGSYDESSFDDETGVIFAIDHIFFNKQHLIEEGEWGDYDSDFYANMRLDAKEIKAPVRKYLGKTVKNTSTEWYTYRDGWYYWQETGGRSNEGFVCLDRAEKLDNGRISVYFHVYNIRGKLWDNDDCYRTPESAQANFWRTLEGHAVVRTGGNLDDRSGWTLERYSFRPAND